MTEASVPGVEGFSAAEPDIATALATRIMALDWMDRRKWTCESQADRHGEIQQMIDAELAPILAEKERLADAKARALEYADTQFNRALAAEAALAGERERLQGIVDLHAEWRKCMPQDWEGDPLSDAIEAAAIRAGE